MIESYDKMPIGMYLRLMEIDAQGLQSDNLIVARVAVLSGRSEAELRSIPIREFKELATKAMFLRTELPTPSGRIAKEYRLEHYTLIPTIDLDKLTTAQYIDFQHYAPTKDDNIIEILSVFLIPKGCKYMEGYNIKAVQDDIREHLTVTQVVTLNAFFFGLYKRSMGVFLTYCRLLMLTMPKEQREKVRTALTALPQDGVGLTMWLPLLKQDI